MRYEFRRTALIASWVLTGTVCAPVYVLAQSTAPQSAAALPGANTTDPAAPFYIDISGIDFSTQPPTRDPLNPKYPPATELPDGAGALDRAQRQLYHWTHAQAGGRDAGGSRGAQGDGDFVHVVVGRQRDLPPEPCSRRERVQRSDSHGIDGWREGIESLSYLVIRTWTRTIWSIFPSLTCGASVHLSWSWGMAEPTMRRCSRHLII